MSNNYLIDITRPGGMQEFVVSCRGIRVIAQWIEDNDGDKEEAERLRAIANDREESARARLTARGYL